MLRFGTAQASTVPSLDIILSFRKELAIRLEAIAIRLKSIAVMRRCILDTSTATDSVPQE